MSIKIGINGFGRIGRQALRSLIEKRLNGEIKKDEIEIVAVNDLGEIEMMAHLLKYDSAYGIIEEKITIHESPKDKYFKGRISVGDIDFGVCQISEPKELPWKKLGVDIVIESTGVFRTREQASQHIKAGAKKVIISAPAKDDKTKTIVLGVNQEDIKPDDNVISNASCTTNCIAPVMSILEDKIGIEKSLMTTVHAYTADQNLVDGPHKDFRRARAAAINTVPTTTGAAIAASKTIPSLEGKFDGMAIRVPVPVGSISDITALTKKDTSIEEINKIIEDECKKPRWNGILTYTNEPLVSSDVIGNSYSSIVDMSLTQVVGGNLIKVVAWYDNEWGYANRLIDQVIQLGAYLK